MKLAIAVVFIGAVAAIVFSQSQQSASDALDLAPENNSDPAAIPDTVPDNGALINSAPIADAVATPDPEPPQSPIETAVEIVTEPIANTAAAVRVAIFGTPYDSLIFNSEDANGLPRNTLWRLLFEESHFRQDIITGKKKSATGALGIAQFEPATAVEELGSVQAALDPNIAIPGAARYLAKLRNSFGGDLTKAVAAYNWGIGHVQRLGLAKAPPETVDYVAQILGVSIGT